MLTILLTRHGHTDRSEPEQYLGRHIHASLTDRGRRDAQGLANRLADIRLDFIISSSLPRAVETALIIQGDRSNEVQLEPRIEELDYGAWEGLTLDEIRRRFPGEYDRYEANPATYKFVGGESGLEFASRVESAVDDWLQSWMDAGSPDWTGVVVGHSSVNRILLAVVLGVPLADYRRRFVQDWANLTVLRWESREDGPLLMLANDQAHSQGTRGATWD